MIPFNYHHLYYFYIIAKTGSITQACKILRLAQPTLSAQLKQFEESLDIKLFEREKKRLSLTEEGKHILFYATDIFSTGNEMIARIDDHSLKGRIKLHIGITHFVPRAVVNALLQHIFSTTPDVYVSLSENTTERLLDGLESHELDIVLSDTPHQFQLGNSIEAHLLAKIPILFCAHESLSKKYKKVPRDLNGAPLLLPTTHSQVYQAVQDYLIEHKITPHIIGEIQDIELVRRLVLAGIGIAPLNQFTVMQAPSSSPLTILPSTHTPSIFESIYFLIKTRKKIHPLIPRILSAFKLDSTPLKTK